MMMDRWMIIWIVDLLGPPDPPMMEAMGVEDAVRMMIIDYNGSLDDNGTPDPPVMEAMGVEGAVSKHMMTLMRILSLLGPPSDRLITMMMIMITMMITGGGSSDGPRECGIINVNV